MNGIHSRFVPAWLRTWYIVNAFVLTPEWMFMMLRPRSLTGGDLSFLFAVFNLYGTKDSLYLKYDDLAVFYIYVLGGIDIAIVCVLLILFQAHSHRPDFAIACMCREVFVGTKTAIYLLYSLVFIDVEWRVPITLMNAQWCIIPAIATFAIQRRLVAALTHKAHNGQHCD